MIKNKFTLAFFLFYSLFFAQNNDDKQLYNINLAEAIQNTNQLLEEFNECKKKIKNLPNKEDKQNLTISLESIEKTTVNFISESKVLIDFMRKNQFKDAEIQMIKVASASLLNSWNLDFQELITKLNSNKNWLHKNTIDFINKRIDDQDVLRVYQIQLISFINRKAKKKDIVKSFEEVN